MTKFKNKKTGKIVEEKLLYYIEKLRNNPNYKEVKIIDKQPKPEKENNEVENDKPLQ